MTKIIKRTTAMVATAILIISTVLWAYPNEAKAATLSSYIGGVKNATYMRYYTTSGNTYTRNVTYAGWFTGGTSTATETSKLDYRYYNNKEYSDDCKIIFPRVVSYAGKTCDLVLYPRMLAGKAKFIEYADQDAYSNQVTNARNLYVGLNTNSYVIFKVKVVPSADPNKIYTNEEYHAFWDNYDNSSIDWQGLFGFADIDHTTVADGDSTVNAYEYCGFKPDDISIIHQGTKVKKQTKTSGVASVKAAQNEGFDVYYGTANSTTNTQFYDSNAIYGVLTIRKEGTEIFYGGYKDAYATRFNFEDIAQNIEIPDPEYKITFDANGGTGSVPEEKVLVGEEASSDISSVKPSKTGYTFMGWAATPEWSSKRIAYSSSSGGAIARDRTKATITGPDWTIYTYLSNTEGLMDSDLRLTLYAQWEKTGYNVTYNSNNATSGTVPGLQTKIYGETLTLQNNNGNLQRTGYTFGGWNTSSAGTGADYAEGSSYTYNSTLTLYAKWIPRTDTGYKVVHWKSKLNADTSVHNEDHYVKEETENCTGTTDANITPETKNYTGFTSPDVQTVTISADGDTVVNYYYTRNKYKLTLKPGQGALVNGQPADTEGYYEYGSKITLTGE